MILSSWWKKTTAYQIYPRSFMDSNGDGIGDLEGIISKLDYIKEIGFETIWFSPFYASPQADFGYDISDYQNIAPEYGTMETVFRLIEEVHQRGMKIVFDMVMNHTSIEHPWFIESKSSKDNPKANWYIWRKGSGKKPPTNWNSMIGGNGWHYVKERDEWFFATFLPFQPDLNYHNPEVKKAMFDTVRFWLGKGVDGLRLDIFNVIIKDPEFRSNPFSWKYIPSEDSPNSFFQENKYTVNYPPNFEFAKELRRVLDEFGEDKKFMIGEVFGDLPTIRKYVGNQDSLHLVFIFEMLRFKFNADYFRKLVKKIETHFAEPAMPVYVFSNHDRKRSIARIGNDIKKAKLLHLFQLTVRGVPFVYNGEEIGMTNKMILLKHALDPIGQKYNFIPQFIANRLSDSLNRDEMRTPMQWDNIKNAGFSIADKTWLPVNENYIKINAKQQLSDENSLLKMIQKLLALRKSEPALNDGSIEIMENGFSKDILAYRRKIDQDDILILINFTNKLQSFTVPEIYTPIFAIGTVENLGLYPYSGILFKKKIT